MLSSQDRDLTLRRYEALFGEHGLSDASLGWGRKGRSTLRYRYLVEGLNLKEASVLDVGGGFGAAYELVKSLGAASYTLIDLSEKFVSTGLKLFGGERDFSAFCGDFLELAFDRTFDVVLISGMFNFELSIGDNYEFIERVLAKSISLSETAVAANFLNREADFHEKGLFYADCAKIWSVARSITPRVLMRTDYFPFEFSVSLFPPLPVSRKQSLYLDSIGSTHEV